jgi:hypothetical protein
MHNSDSTLILMCDSESAYIMILKKFKYFVASAPSQTKRSASLADRHALWALSLNHRVEVC